MSPRLVRTSACGLIEFQFVDQTQQRQRFILLGGCRRIPARRQGAVTAHSRCVCAGRSVLSLRSCFSEGLAPTSLSFVICHPAFFSWLSAVSLKLSLALSTVSRLGNKTIIGRW